MEKIKSFTINHNEHGQGFYLSGEVEGIFTYDLRFKKPNGGDYLNCAVMHTIEHLFATAIRNGAKKEKVVYFGPMGCRTGFYLLLKDINKAEAQVLCRDAFAKCLELEEVPGSKKIECGNYRSHNLNKAKEEIKSYLKFLESSK